MKLLIFREHQQDLTNSESGARPHCQQRWSAKSPSLWWPAMCYQDSSAILPASSPLSRTGKGLPLLVRTPLRSRASSIRSPADSAPGEDSGAAPPMDELTTISLWCGPGVAGLGGHPPSLLNAPGVPGERSKAPLLLRSSSSLARSARLSSESLCRSSDELVRVPMARTAGLSAAKLGLPDLVATSPSLPPLAAFCSPGTRAGPSVAFSPSLSSAEFCTLLSTGIDGTRPDVAAPFAALATASWRAKAATNASWASALSCLTRNCSFSNRSASFSETRESS